jgi:cytochrome c-type biogenesis protein
MSAAFLVMAAFLAGMVSISSPCCLPLLPGYVAYLGGTGPPNLRRTMTAAGLFVAGFGATFTVLGASASWLGAALLTNQPLLLRAGGLLVAAMGVATMLGAGIPGLSGERRLLALHRAPLGAAFALGWTPCIGPVLAGLLATAAASRTAAVGAGLLAVYAAGLAVPFLLLAWAVVRGRAGVGLLRRHHHALARVGGVMLVVVGLAMAAGAWTPLFAPLVRLFVRSGWPPI